MADPTLFDAPYDNRSLFSDHYLTERLPGRDVWEEDVGAAFEAAKALYERERAALQTANEAQTEERFFHWELAFPEVFFDLKRSAWKQNPGFDAVIGNPPWVNVGRKSGGESEVQYFKSAFQTAEYQIDLYTLFLERGVELIRENAFLGEIVPDPWLSNYRTPKVRRLLLIENQPLQIVHTPRSAFPEVGAEHLIFLAQSCGDCTSSFLKGELNENGEIVAQDEFTHDLLREKDAFVVYSTSKAANIIEQIEDKSFQLGERFDTVRGVGPYHHNAQEKGVIESRAYHADHKKNETFVPELKGKHLAPYEIAWDERYWISYGDWLAEPREARFFSGKRLLLREILSDRFAVSVIKKKFIVDRGIYIALQGNQQTNLYYVLAVLASHLLIFWFREKFSEKDELFPKLRMAHFNMLPIREITFTTPDGEREAAAGEIVEAWEEAVQTQQRSNAASPLPGNDDSTAHMEEGAVQDILNRIDDHLSAEPERADVVHDVLAFLAERMTDLHAERRRLEAALDPFKFLDRGAAFAPFRGIFSEALKYGERLTEGVDLGAAHHDVDGLRLVPEGEGVWRLEVQLKKRDPEAGWQDWQKDGHRIARAWAPAYRFELDEARGRYYQHAFRVLGDFAEAGSLPGGYTRSTHKKLHAAEVPVYDSTADLTPLVELSAERAAAQQAIARTDHLIDRIVYRLYGLADEEIAVVEGR